jgi:hypothetical protein
MLMSSEITKKPNIASSFESQVMRLHKDWKSLQSAFENLTSRQLQFAQLIKDLWVQAKNLDSNLVTDVHQSFVRDQLRIIVRSDSASILSRWVTIGTEAPKLLPHAASLPSQRDALYETAKAIRQREGIILKWIEKGQISPESTVREVKALASGKKKVTRKQSKTSQSLVSVELHLALSYGDSARLLLELVQDAAVVRVKSHTALKESFKEVLGKEKYAPLTTKFT